MEKLTNIDDLLNEIKEKDPERYNEIIKEVQKRKEEYENKQKLAEKIGLTFDPPHPGEILKENYLKPLKLSVTDAASKLGVTRKALSELINGKSGISPKMALRLSKAFNTSPQMWLNMQLQYDLWHAIQEMNMDEVQIIWTNNNNEDIKKAS